MRPDRLVMPAAELHRKPFGDALADPCGEDALVRAVASTVLRKGGRAIDVCGGSGHLTRALVPFSAPAPVR